MKSQPIYRAARLNNDWRAVRSGDPSRIARRVARRAGWRWGTKLLKGMFR